VTISFHATDSIHAIRSLFEGMEDMKDIYLPRARNENDFYIRWVLQAHGTCQVRSRVPSETAAKCDNNRLEILLHNTPFELIYRFGANSATILLFLT
jgi:hypothetical protein